MSLAKILSIIGGLLMLILGVLKLLGHLGINLFSVPGVYGGLGLLTGIFVPIVLIVVGLLTLIATGTVKGSSTKVGFNGVTILILGIVGLLFGGDIWAILLIIAGILMLI